MHGRPPERSASRVAAGRPVPRLTTWRSRPACALRAALMAATARLAPDLMLRALDGIADRWPPGGTYASGTRGTRAAAQPKEHE